MSALSTSRPVGVPAGRAELAYRFDAWTIVLGVFAFSNLANGVWMLVDPVHWYENLPAAVPDFGPLNEHFIRDIGCIFTLIGVGLAVASVVPRWRVPACAAAAPPRTPSESSITRRSMSTYSPEIGSVDQPGLAATWNRTIQPRPRGEPVTSGVPSVSRAQV